MATLHQDATLTAVISVSVASVSTVCLLVCLSALAASPQRRTFINNRLFGLILAIELVGSLGYIASGALVLSGSNIAFVLNEESTVDATTAAVCVFLGAVEIFHTIAVALMQCCYWLHVVVVLYLRERRLSGLDLAMNDATAAAASDVTGPALASHNDGLPGATTTELLRRSTTATTAAGLNKTGRRWRVAIHALTVASLVASILVALASGVSPGSLPTIFSDRLPWRWLSVSWQKWLLGYVWEIVALVLFFVSLVPAYRIFFVHNSFGAYIFAYRSGAVLAWLCVFALSAFSRTTYVLAAFVIPAEGIADSIAFLLSERYLETWTRRLRAGCRRCVRKAGGSGPPSFTSGGSYPSSGGVGVTLPGSPPGGVYFSGSLDGGQDDDGNSPLLGFAELIETNVGLGDDGKRRRQSVRLVVEPPLHGHHTSGASSRPKESTGLLSGDSAATRKSSSGTDILAC